jgi:cytochrome c oxidase subunit I
MPIFTWNFFVTAILILIAFPVLTSALFGLRPTSARTYSTPPTGGDPPMPGR